jgi:hypothetical protein
MDLRGQPAAECAEGQGALAFQPSGATRHPVEPHACMCAASSPLLSLRTGSISMLRETDLSSSLPSRPDELIAQAVEDGICRYFAARRRRVPAFIDRHFSLRGSLAVHRRAVGFDLLRAPANLLLMGPHAGMKAAGLLFDKLRRHRIARRLEARSLLLRTDVSRQIEWLVMTELLELPHCQRERAARRDALAETILADPRLTGLAEERLRAVGRRADDPVFRAQLLEAMTTYGSTRAAAAEITTSLLTLSSGALALKQLTPGAVTLGPALAALIARQSAISAFPLGASLGGFWYGIFPVAPPAVLVAGLTGGLMIAASCAAAFAGLATDPIQRRLGLHARRLNRLLGAIERQMLDPAAPAFTVHDHYVARLLDVFDLLGSAYRLAQG